MKIQCVMRLTEIREMELVTTSAVDVDLRSLSAERGELGDANKEMARSEDHRLAEVGGK
ncbi:MAG: hypothetical protein ACYDGR_07265 [Candidatus Dormibacteria bacterium]